MTRPPMMAPITVPTPPVTAAPPMKAAAMASSSKLVPAFGLAAVRRAVVTSPARPASSPMLVITRKSTCLVLTPDMVAASTLPPIA